MLKVTNSVHNMPCIEVRKANKRVQDIIKRAVTCQYMTDQRYILSGKAGAFLQGYDEQSGWILVEFWQPDYQPFVDLLNKLIDEDKAKQ